MDFAKGGRWGRSQPLSNGYVGEPTNRTAIVPIKREMLSRYVNHIIADRIRPTPPQRASDHGQPG